ncbi:MAG: hypothetical protein MMC33_005043 [Icmadophila ericetorum]|nr:hypothetical protein [Icmadophila ericetorum]
MESTQVPETITYPHPGPAPRRAKIPPPIQTSFASKSENTSRMQRPRPIETIIYEKPLDRVPLQPTGRRSSSKGGLLGFFNRKSTKIAKVDGQLEVPKEELEEPARRLPAGINIPVIKSRSSTTIREIPTNSKVSEPPTPKVPTRPVSAASKSKPNRKTPKSDHKDPIIASQKSWDPPPLFQAYPQAVKHATLAAPILSADTILRMNKQKPVKPAQGTSSKSLDTNKITTGDNSSKNQGPKRHRRLPSKIDWTTKVYVLATSGFLLQYTGDGSFDRLPEKLLQLGKDSAAFASDAIAGKHWVLQISQTSNEDGTAGIRSSRSMFSRMGLRSDSRRSASTFLLVLDSPEEMNAWLVAVRKQIETLGGKQYRPDTGIQMTTEDAERQLRERPSRRYLIQRDPSQFPDSQSERHNSLGLQSDNFSLHSTRRQSYATDAPSTTHTSMSIDQAQLDRLRESSRYSYASDSARSLATSHGTSPLPSPTKSHFTFDKAPSEESGSLTPRISDSSRRRSFQTLPTTLEVRRPLHDLRSPRPLSTHDSALSSPSSATTPNFSVPTFSKRYSQIPSQMMPIPIEAEAFTRNSPAQTSQYSERTSSRPVSVVGELPSSVKLSPKDSRTRLNGPSPTTSPPLMMDSKHHEFRLVSSLPDRPVPRRYSSMEYAHGKVPFTLRSHAPSPHPPPQAALPAIPKSMHPNPLASQPPPPRSSSAPNLTKHSLRRPASMQVRPSLPSSYNIPHISSLDSRNFPSISSTVSSSQPINSGIQYLQQQSQIKMYRRSMSQMQSRGPPPPMPLPPTPPVDLDTREPGLPRKGWPVYSMGANNSLQGVRVS